MKRSELELGWIYDKTVLSKNKYGGIAEYIEKWTLKLPHFTLEILNHEMPQVPIIHRVAEIWRSMSDHFPVLRIEVREMAGEEGVNKIKRLLVEKLFHFLYTEHEVVYAGNKQAKFEILKALKDLAEEKKANE